MKIWRRFGLPFVFILISNFSFAHPIEFVDESSNEISSAELSEYLAQAHPEDLPQHNNQQTEPCESAPQFLGFIHKKPYTIYAASLGSSALTSGLMFPLSLKKMRMQTGSLDKGHYYRGAIPALVGSCVNGTSSLATYEFMKEKGYNPTVSSWGASFVSHFLSSPIWIFATKNSLSIEKDGKPYSFRHYLNDLCKDPKIAYRSNVVWLIQFAPHSIYAETFEGTKRLLKEVKNEDDSNPILSDSMIEGIAGGCARLSESAIKHPMDTLRVIREESGKSYLEIIADLNKQGLSRYYRGYWIGTARGMMGTFAVRGMYRWMYNQLSDEESGKN